MWLTIWCYDGVPFPGNEFPASFKDVHLRKMVRLLFHVLAHVYHSHFKEIVLLQLHAHLNALFAHFVGFSVRFSLLEDKELEVRSARTSAGHWTKRLPDPFRDLSF